MSGRPWRAIWTVVWKDWTVVRRSPMVLLPMILVPILLQIVLPVGIGLAALYAPDQFSADPDMQRILSSLPAEVIGDYGDISVNGQMMILTLVYLFAPMYLIVPMMVSSVIAADSFVGERERKTLEALLYTPLSDNDLLLAKTLTAWLAAMAVSVVSFALYSVAVNAVGYQVVGRLFFPNGLWLALVLWVVPAVAGMGLAATVLISSRVNTFQEAYQAGGIIVIPIIGLVLGQLAGVIFLSFTFAIALGALIWLLDALMLWYGRRNFRREDLLARL